MLNQKIVHVGAGVVSVGTALAGFLTAITGTLPTGYRGAAVEVAALLSAALVGIKAFDSAAALNQAEQPARIDS